MAAWDARARPVPVEAARAALSAVAEECQVLLLDPAGPLPFVVPRPAVWALAQHRPWTPAPHDPVVLEAVAEAARVQHVVAVRCEPGEQAELRIVLGVRPGLDAAGVQVLVAAVQDRLAASEAVADRVDSLELRLLPA
jgi:hypothetical protein